VQSSVANQQQVEIRQADVGGFAAAVAAAQARLEAAEFDLSYATISAPVDGVVTRKSVEAGQIVSPGQGLMTVIPLNDVWVTANFKETQLAKMRVGQPVEIEVDAYPGMKLHGTVQSFSGATGARFSLLPPENATGNFTKVVQRVPVRIKLDAVPEDRPLRPGMSVEAVVDTRK